MAKRFEEFNEETTEKVAGKVGQAVPTRGRRRSDKVGRRNQMWAQSDYVP